MFPLIFNVYERLCVVVGAGPVGQRKASALLQAGARVRLIDPKPISLDLDKTRLERIQKPYQASMLEGACLAFAAATPEINKQVVADARAARLPVNSADPPQLSDFTVPASFRRGDLLVTVSTGGAAPALARRIRDELETVLNRGYAEWVALLGEVRPMVQAMVPDPLARQRLLEAFCGSEWLERLQSDGMEAVRTLWQAEVARTANIEKPL